MVLFCLIRDLGLHRRVVNIVLKKLSIVMDSYNLVTVNLIFFFWGGGLSKLPTDWALGKSVPIFIVGYWQKVSRISQITPSIFYVENIKSKVTGALER